jgi:hypothetical protein
MDNVKPVARVKERDGSFIHEYNAWINKSSTISTYIKTSVGDRNVHITHYLNE